MNTLQNNIQYLFGFLKSVSNGRRKVVWQLHL